MRPVKRLPSKPLIGLAERARNIGRGHADPQHRFGARELRQSDHQDAAPAGRQAVAVLFDLLLRICSNPFSTWVTNSYAKVCQRLLPRKALRQALAEGPFAAQLPVTAHARHFHASSGIKLAFFSSRPCPMNYNTHRNSMLLAAAAIGLGLSPGLPTVSAQATTNFVRYGISMADIPLTTGQPGPRRRRLPVLSL